MLKASLHTCLSWSEFVDSSLETMFICSLVSVVASISMLLAALFSARLRRPPWPLKFRAMLCDVAVSWSLLCLVRHALPHHAFVNTPLTQMILSKLLLSDFMEAKLRVAAKLTFVFFEMMAIGYRILIWWHLVNIMRNPFRSHLYPKFVFGWITLTIILIAGASTDLLHEGENHLPEILSIALAGPLVTLLCFGVPPLMQARRIARERLAKCPSSPSPSVELQQHILRVDTFYFLSTLLHHVIRFGIFVLCTYNCSVSIRVVVAIATLRPAFAVLSWICSIIYAWSQGDMKGSIKERLRLELVYNIACNIGALAHVQEDLRTVSILSQAKSHEREKFKSIRELFNVQQTYEASFPGTAAHVEPDWCKIEQRLKESVSEGASGSFFYRVSSPTSSFRHRQFIVKQVKETEKNTLLNILDAYIDHVKTCKGNSLIQYVGCHSISLSHNKDAAESFFFVVMPNFLPAQMWLTFDLKGNTMKRRVLDFNMLHGAGVLAQDKYSTLRDWDWLDAVMAVEIGDKEKTMLKGMIEADARFLAQQNLLDYSLILGIHRLDATLSSEQRELEIVRLQAAGGPGAFVSIDRQKVYFFGIIDILECYGRRWKVQHAVLKAACLLTCQGKVGADSISAMPPKEYAERFETFISEQVLDGEQASAATKGVGRWQRLWLPRCGGLMRKRIYDEADDKRRRLKELEERLLSAST